MAKLLYNKTEASQLTAEERQHIITLSSIAGAVAGGVTSQTSNQSNTTANTVQNAALGGEIGKSAVENNHFWLSHKEWSYSQKLKELDPEAYEKRVKEQQELINNSVSVLADFAPIIGDIKGFVEAETTGDYFFAALGTIPLVGDTANVVYKSKKAYEVAKQVGDVEGMKSALDNAAKALPSDFLSTPTGPLGSRYNQMNQPKNPIYQPVRNTASYIAGREYSGHALDRMQDRGIMPSVVENTIKYGNKTTDELGVSIYKDNINGIKVITNNKGKVITVTYEK